MLCGSSLNFLNFIESNKRACIISTQSEKHTEWNISSEHCPTPRTRIGMFPGPNTHVPFPAPPPHRWDDHLPDSCVFSLWAGATKCMLPCVPASARHWLCEILPWRCMGWIAYSLPDSFCCFFSMTVMWALGAVRNWNGDVELTAACEHDWSMYVACLENWTPHHWIPFHHMNIPSVLYPFVK